MINTRYNNEQAPESKYQDQGESDSHEIYLALKNAVEIGKWPDGQTLSAEQKAVFMQSIIAWEYHNLPEEDRIGWLPGKPNACASKTQVEMPTEETLRWRE